jgi:hypothetical protein
MINLSLQAKMGWYEGASFSIPHDLATALTNHEIKAAPALTYRIYITDITIDMGATSRLVQILDGSAGTVLWQSTLTAGTSINLKFATPIQLTAATALCVTSAGNSVGAFLRVGGFTSRNY